METTVNYRSHKIKIVHDPYYPFDDTDHPVNSYGRGEWRKGPDSECTQGECYEWISIWMRDYDLSAGIDSPDEFMERFPEDEWEVFTVRGYSHGGTHFSLSNSYPFNCPWDSGMAGMVAIKKDINPEILNGKTIREFAAMRVECFDAYFNGEFYFWEVEGELTDDSCGGYLVADDADVQYMISEAKERIDWDVEILRKTQIEKRKAQIKNRVPLQYRKPIIAI